MYLVEAADDICYEIMDIEDAHKLRLLSTAETIELYLGFFDETEREQLRRSYPEGHRCGRSDQIPPFVCDQRPRTGLVQVFVENEAAILSGTFTGSLIRHLPERLKTAYENCAAVAHKRIYLSKEVVDIELSGFHIIYTLLELMCEAVISPEKNTRNCC